MKLAEKILSMQTEEVSEASKDIVKVSKKVKKQLQNFFDALVDLKVLVLKEEESAGRDGKLLVKGIESKLQQLSKWKDITDFVTDK